MKYDEKFSVALRSAGLRPGTAAERIKLYNLYLTGIIDGVDITKEEIRKDQKTAGKQLSWLDVS